jgi:hypothetical protein
MHWRDRSRLILTVVVFIGGTVGVSQYDSAQALPPKEDATTILVDEPTILPGEGVKGCHIGGPIQNARNLFGKPTSEHGEYIHFADKGVEALVTEGKISALFFYYRSRTHKEYAGKTEAGIGKESSIEDILKQYGKPDWFVESVVSAAGAEPGANEIRLVYRKLGIGFTFHDKRLANVRVFAKKVE